MLLKFLKSEDTETSFSSLGSKREDVVHNNTCSLDRKKGQKWTVMKTPIQNLNSSLMSSETSVDLGPELSDLRLRSHVDSKCHEKDVSMCKCEEGVFGTGHIGNDEGIKTTDDTGNKAKGDTATPKTPKYTVLHESICELGSIKHENGQEKENDFLSLLTSEATTSREMWITTPRYRLASMSSVDEPTVRVGSPALIRPPPPLSFSPMPLPRHWSVFYPEGIDRQPPVLLHYLVLGGWRTVAGGWDYFSHRRLKEGEVSGHTVRWLHSAKPRDRFVFAISPVEPKREDEKVGIWRKLGNNIYGNPPAFAYRKGKLFRKPSVNNAQGSPLRTEESAMSCVRLPQEEERTFSPVPRLSPLNKNSCLCSLSNADFGPGNRQEQKGGFITKTTSIGGVEVVEVKHEDVTATDYSPRLSSSRFAIEAKAVYAYFFPTMEEAYAYYGCLEDLQLVEMQTRRGVTNTLPHDYKRCSNKSDPRSNFGAHDSSYCNANGEATTSTGNDMYLTPRRTEVTESISETNIDIADWRLKKEEEEEEEEEEVRHIVKKPQTSHGGVRKSLKTSKIFQKQKALQQEEQWRDYSLTTQLEFLNDKERYEETRCVSRKATAIPLTREPRVIPTLTTVHFDTIVSIYSEDPNFNAVLREVLMPEPGTHPYTASLKEQRRMLSMYETGMPAWTIFLASTGLVYRRVLRLTFVGLVNIWPVISLFVGLYDLYKHLPQMKTFLSTTLAPLLESIERHVTLRLSMFVTYIISVGVSVAASFTSFLSQFYILELFPLPLRIFGRLLQHPLVLVFELLWTVISIVISFMNFLYVTLKLIIMGPFVLVTHLAALDFGNTAVLPAAAEGTSLTLKWWRAWQEFWVTVASPVKNLAKAWYDSVVHVAVSAARREASIRRWYTPKLRSVLAFGDNVREMCAINLTLWWQLWGPGWGLWLLHAVLIFCCICALRLHLNDGIHFNNGNNGTDIAPTTLMMTNSGGVTESRALVLMAPVKTVAVEEKSSSPEITESLIDNVLGNGYDDLFFAWETLISVWIQLPW